jgi:putative transposase
MREKYEVSKQHACRLLGQWRRTQRYAAIQRIDEDALTEALVALARKYGRYGYRRITALLQRAGWHVGKDRENCGSGWRSWAREPCTSNQGVRERTGTVRAFLDCWLHKSLFTRAG